MELDSELQQIRKAQKDILGRADIEKSVADIIRLAEKCISKFHKFALIFFNSFFLQWKKSTIKNYLTTIKNLYLYQILYQQHSMK